MVVEAKQAVPTGLQDGIRETCRIELTEELQAHLLALLRQVAGSRPAEPAERLRAVGGDLAYLQGYAALLEHQGSDAELDEESRILRALASGAVRELDRLVRRLDDEIGLDRGQPWRIAGLRETYIAGIRSPQVRSALQRMVELAHAESLAESPPPTHPLRESLRSLSAELTYLADYLAAEREAVAQKLSQACRRIAGGIRLAVENAPTLHLFDFYLCGEQDAI